MSYYTEHEKIVRQKWRKLNRDKENARNRRWYKIHREKAQQYVYQYRLKHRKQHLEYQNEFRKSYRAIPEVQIKIKARAKIHSQIKSGKIKRQSCEIENCLNKSDAHHDNYSQPLKVRWLCRKHHAELHRKIRQLNH